jgi:hypothetical protein
MKKKSVLYPPHPNPLPQGGEGVVRANVIALYYLSRFLNPH